ncbi:cytochrome P450 [Boletus reticuloceps]|uniref:Cytochrome P450 n=1 Tax=Boletus reticuloceps TaxID=495285 RepID=A0A8I2YSV3_9AGAM|nr:cytochrome P450 [Boletus reticuloceps]
MMMVLNPAVQEKAQVEIDRDRLPTMDDRPLLPFIDAIFRETLRYSPAEARLRLLIPLNHVAVPHIAVDDDVYRGFRIPKGQWHTTKPGTPDPHSFIPERFLNDDGSLKPKTPNTSHLDSVDVSA